MDLQTYAKVSVVNLCFLITGLVLGSKFIPQVETTVQAAKQETAKDQPPPSGVTSGGRFSPKIIAVTPTMTTGTVGIYLILSHHVQADELVVNGYDVLKLQNAELALLSKFVPEAQIKSAVDSAKADEVYQVAQLPQVQAPTIPTPK